MCPALLRSLSHSLASKLMRNGFLSMKCNALVSYHSSNPLWAIISCIVERAHRLHFIISLHILLPHQEMKFRREMEKLRNGQQRDITLEVERDRAALIQQTIKQLNTQYNRRSSAGGNACQFIINFVALCCIRGGQERNGVGKIFLTPFLFFGRDSPKRKCVSICIISDFMDRIT